MDRVHRFGDPWSSQSSSAPSAWLYSISLKWDLGTVDRLDQDFSILVLRSLSWAIILSIILSYVCAATNPWKNKTKILNLILILILIIHLFSPLEMCCHIRRFERDQTYVKTYWDGFYIEEPIIWPTEEHRIPISHILCTNMNFGATLLRSLRCRKFWIMSSSYRPWHTNLTRNEPPMTSLPKKIN